MLGLSLILICLLAGTTSSQNCDPGGERIDCGEYNNMAWPADTYLVFPFKMVLLLHRILWYWPDWVWGRTRLLLVPCSRTSESCIPSCTKHVQRCAGQHVLLIFQGAPWCFRNTTTTKTCESDEDMKFDCGKITIVLFKVSAKCSISSIYASSSKCTDSAGYFGVGEEECNAMGCCWEESIVSTFALQDGCKWCTLWNVS